MENLRRASGVLLHITSLPNENRLGCFSRECNEFIDFLSSPEDVNLKYQYSNLLKIIRIFAFLITLFLPGIYVAITNYHSELLPTELLFTIAASRNTVPFPVIFEILLMEISFELIREAGLRVPTPIGPTIRNCWCINSAVKQQLLQI